LTTPMRRFDSFRAICIGLWSLADEDGDIEFSKLADELVAC
jgi:hypothetical protein